MTPTALIVTPHPVRARACRPAFVRSGYMPLIVGSIHEAIRLLRQFRTDLIVIHAPDNARIDAPSRDWLTRAAGPTRIITASELSTMVVPPLS